MSERKIGRYEIKSRLGRGGMATVFLAVDPLIGREVAVKTLPREFLHDPSFRGRFQREARTIAMLEHPAIVPIYDFGEQEGQPYLVMRYMKGGTLGDLLRKGPLSVAEAAGILKRLGSALDHAHQRGVIHRDLKPGNILFDEYQSPFLSDFGIVKLAQSTVTYTGNNVVGTPAYMSPEQIHGHKDIDGRSDLYTLGVILFEMLSGKMPYQEDTPAKIMMAHVLNPVPRIQTVRPDLPEAVDNVIGRALSKEPDGRFRTASEMAEALEEAGGYKPLPGPATVRERPAGTASKSRPHRKRSTTQNEPQSRDAPPPPPARGADPVSSAAVDVPQAESSSSRRLLWPALIAGLFMLLCCGGLFMFAILGGDGDNLTAADASPTASETVIGTQVEDLTVDTDDEAVLQAVRLIRRAQQTEPVFGPESGDLVHTVDGAVSGRYGDGERADFLMGVTFVNPYAASEGDWDVGLIFRQTSIDEHYRLVVDADGQWALISRSEQGTRVIEEALLDNLRTGANERNRMLLLAIQERGFFFVNGKHVKMVDLSGRTAPGRMGIATSFFEGNEIEGEATGYEAFTIWAPQE